MRPAGRRALSLLEIVIASVVLTIGLMPLIVLFSGSLGRVKVSRPDFVAGALAGEVMEQMRLVPFSQLRMGPDQMINLDLLAGQPAPAATADLQAKIPLVLGTYPAKFNVKILAEPMTPPELLARITVTVTYDRSSATVTDTGTVVLSEWVESRVPRMEL